MIHRMIRVSLWDDGERVHVWAADGFDDWKDSVWFDGVRRETPGRMTDLPQTAFIVPIVLSTAPSRCARSGS